MDQIFARGVILSLMALNFNLISSPTTHVRLQASTAGWLARWLAVHGKSVDHMIAP